MNKIFIVLGGIMFTSFTTEAQQFWVANAGSHTLSVIENDTIKTIPCGQGPREILYIPGTQHVYVNECGEPALALYDVMTIKHFKTFKLPDEARGLTLSPDGKHLYYVLKNRDTLVEWDVAGEHSSRQVPTPSGPRHIAIDDVNYRIYLSCNDANCVAVFDRVTFKKLAEIPTAQRPYALILDDGVLYVSSIGKNVVQAFATQDFQLLWEASCGLHPTAIVAGPASDLWVTNLDQHQITRLHSKTGALIEHIPVGREPFALQVVATGLAFTMHGENTLGLYNIKEQNLWACQVGAQPHGLCVIQKGEKK